MLTKLLRIYEVCWNGYSSAYWRGFYSPAVMVKVVVENNSQRFGGFVRKGQEQMMADYLMLKLVEMGKL